MKADEHECKSKLLSQGYDLMDRKDIVAFNDYIDDNPEMLNFESNGINLVSYAVHFPKHLALMLSKGADPNLCLGSAIMNGDIEIIEMILGYGADLNKRDEYDELPIYKCILSEKCIKQTDVFFYLLERGTKLEPHDILELFDKFSASGFHTALQFLIDEYSASYPEASPNAEKLLNLSSPLLSATSRAYKNTVKVLLGNGAVSKDNFYDLRNSFIKSLTGNMKNSAIAEMIAEALISVSDFHVITKSLVASYTGTDLDLFNKVWNTLSSYTDTVRKAVGTHEIILRAIIGSIAAESGAVSRKNRESIKNFMSERMNVYFTDLDTYVSTLLAESDMHVPDMQLQEILFRIDELLRKVTDIDIFNPSIDASAIESQDFETYNIDILKVLYEWHNGFNEERLSPEYSGLAFLPYAQARYMSDDEVSPKYIFTIMSGLFGSTLCVDLRPNSLGGCAYLFDLNIEKGCLVFRSVSHFFMMIHELLISNAIKVEDGKLYWAPNLFMNHCMKWSLGNGHKFDSNIEPYFETIFE